MITDFPSFVVKMLVNFENKEGDFLMNELKNNMKLLALKQQRQGLMIELNLTSDDMLKRRLMCKLKAVEKQLDSLN